MAKDLDLSGLDDIYTDKEGNSKKVDLSGLDDVYSDKKKEEPEDKRPFYARPVLPSGAARDLVSGIGEHLPLVPQIMGAGDVINKTLSGEIDPTDIEELKKAYESGRLSLPKIQDKATANSPIANRIGQGLGIVGGGALAGPSVKGMAGLGGLMAASQGATPIITGNAKDRDKGLGEIENGIITGGALGLGGKALGANPKAILPLVGAGAGGYGAYKTAEGLGGNTPENIAAGIGGAGLGMLAGMGGNTATTSALSSPAAKAFLASMKGAKLTGPGAVDAAGNKLLSANNEASQGVDQLRQQIGKARDVIENSQANQKIDLSDSLTNMIKRFENLTGNERVEAEKAGLMDIAKPKAPYSEITPMTKEVPAIPGTKEKLAAQGELAVQKEAALGNEASYDIIPGKDSQGKDTLSLVIRKRSAPTGKGESLISSKGGGVEDEMQGMAEDMGLEQPKMESSPENYVDENVSVKPQYAEEGVPASQKTSFQRGEEVPNRQPLNSEMSLKQALDMRTKLRAMSQDSDLHPMVRQAARDGLTYLQTDLKSQVPELAQNDAHYAALKNAQKLFGKKYNNQDQLIQSTKQANLLDRANEDSINGSSAKQQLSDAIENVRKVSPELADKMEQSLSSSLENFNLTKTANAPDINLTSLNQSLKKSSAWLGAKAGETAHSVMNNPVMRASKSLYSAGNDALKEFSQTMKSSGGPTGERMSQALDQAVDSNNSMAKNAIIFSIMQNPMLRTLVPTDHEEAP